MYGGQQVGYAWLGGIGRASLWSGSAGSWVDLHSFLPSGFISSEAHGIWTDGTFTYVVGYGYNGATGRNEALMWVVPEPASGLVVMVSLIVVILRQPGYMDRQKRRLERIANALARPGAHRADPLADAKLPG